MSCNIPGMCSRSPDCKDHNCASHPVNNWQEDEWWVSPAMFVVALLVLAFVTGGLDVLTTYIAQVNP
jgi:hypothetical protein